MAAYALAAAGAFLALVGAVSPLLGGDLGSVAIFGIIGLLIVALSTGLHFNLGFARVLSVVIAVPAAFVGLLAMAFSEGIWYVLLPGAAILLASGAVLFAVATTANWYVLLGMDQ
jgi:hypothetical protein